MQCFAKKAKHQMGIEDYTKFEEILRKVVEDKKISARKGHVQLEELFKGYQNLIPDYNMLMPRRYQIRSSSPSSAMSHPLVPAGRLVEMTYRTFSLNGSLQICMHAIVYGFRLIFYSS